MMHFKRDVGDKEGIFVEKIPNVIGSTAGAGSGEFYTYRNQRRDDLAREKQKEKELLEDGRKKDFEESVKAGIMLTELKAQKKKEKRNRKNKNRKIAAEAKSLNKFENDGTFLKKRLLEKNEQNSTDLQINSKDTVNYTSGDALIEQSPVIPEKHLKVQDSN